jgi:hypothetical protein
LKKPDLVPREYAVPRPPATAKTPIFKARTICYAMSKIAQGVPLRGAIASTKGHDDIDAAGVAVVYSQFVKNETDDEGRPNPEVVKNAIKWLSTGALN